MRDRFSNVAQIKSDLIAMVDYYNLLSDKEFSKVLDYFSKEVGYGDEYAKCTFSSSIEPWEDGYFENGVMFTTSDGTEKESISIVNYESFYHYLSLACSDYVERNPEDKEKISILLDRVRMRFNINSSKFKD